MVALSVDPGSLRAGGVGLDLGAVLHQVGDDRAEGVANVGEGRVGVLDDVVQQAGDEDLLAESEPVEDYRHAERIRHGTDEPFLSWSRCQDADRRKACSSVIEKTGSRGRFGVMRIVPVGRRTFSRTRDAPACQRDRFGTDWGRPGETVRLLTGTTGRWRGSPGAGRRLLDDRARREKASAAWSGMMATTAAARDQADSIQIDYEAGLKAFTAGDYPEAETRFKASVKKAETLGPKSVVLAGCLHGFGCAHFMQGKVRLRRGSPSRRGMGIVSGRQRQRGRSRRSAASIAWRISPTRGRITTRRRSSSGSP